MVLIASFVNWKPFLSLFLSGDILQEMDQILNLKDVCLCHLALLFTWLLILIFRLHVTTNIHTGILSIKHSSSIFVSSEEAVLWEYTLRTRKNVPWGIAPSMELNFSFSMNFRSFIFPHCNSNLGFFLALWSKMNNSPQYSWAVHGQIHLLY